MANQQHDDDLDLGIEDASKSNKKIIIIIVAAVLLLGAGVGWYLLKGGPTDQVPGGEPAQQSEQRPAIYHPLDPLFIVNLPPGGKAQMLQAGIQVMVRDPELVEFIQQHDPMVRHALLNLLSSQSADGLQQRSGKQKLQQQLLQALNKLIREQGGPGAVEAVYFTSFVTQ